MTRPGFPRLPRRIFYACLSLASLVCLPAIHAQDVQYGPQGEQIPGPNCGGIPQYNGGKPRTCQPEEFSAWLNDVRHWRAERTIRVGLDRSEYDRPELKWTQSSFIQPQMMVHDRYFYDPATQRYTVDKYLADVEARYGGIDSVLIWHTYPNIGIDDRNQFDLLRDMPGGIPALKAMVADFHRHGVKVLFPVMAWDQGTRETQGTRELSPENDSGSMWQALAEELKEIGADGVNGDTLDGIPRLVASDAIALQHPLGLEPESGVASDETLAWNTLTWGYWRYGFVPTISRYKWLETRHMVNICNRWAHDHTDDLQFAFFNGAGFESWENIWGIWNQLTPRDAESLRRISLIERAFAPQLISPLWEPHTPTRNFGVFASKWPGATPDGPTLWTLVNRNAYSVDGSQIEVAAAPGAHYYDLWNGVELHPAQENGASLLRFPIEPSGYGAILETKALTAGQEKLLAQMKSLAEHPLQSYSSLWKSMPQSLVEISPTSTPAKAPKGMTKIPGDDFTFRVNGIEIEGMNDEGVDVQYPWEPSARRYHEHRMHLKSFWIDTYPVTNAEFRRFMDETHYAPADAHNFLRDWKGGTYPDGWASKPVTWVSIEDARAYAKWAGKRLPHEWEWQYAAQGTDGRRFPWGDFESQPAAPQTLPPPTRAAGQNNATPSPEPIPAAPATPQAAGTMPYPDHGRTMDPAATVNLHPNGASPFGVMDLTGNVWQWTDEYQDEHTRYAILRGGSHYQPRGSRWYFPQAEELSQHGKYLLMAPSLDRSGAVGFRCVMDADEKHP
jgi:formylglycine-generating enzyme required for sulfatase activity